MTIDGAKSAREFVRAWAGHPGAARAYTMAAESQRVVANLCRRGYEQAAARHDAAAEILERAAIGQRPEPDLEWDDDRAEEGYDCPRCDAWIPIHRQFCPDCGLDTSLLGGAS